MAKPIYRPGERAPRSGQYPVVGPRGGDVGREVTVTRGGGTIPADAGTGHGLRKA